MTIEQGTMMEDFREVGRRLSNWGRWGADDRIGTLNHITPERLVAATRLARTGKLFDLGLVVQSRGIQPAGWARANPIHLMNMTPLDLKDDPHHMCVADDYIMMPLQSVTQWDGLAHVGYDERLYNDIPAASVTTMNGSQELSIHQIARKGVAGRGVLLDITRLKGVERLAAPEPITPLDLEAAMARQGVEVGPGDILLIRTGWIRHFLVDGCAETFWQGEPGLTLECAEWLHARDVASVCSDNWGIETMVPDMSGPLPLHCVLIRDMGMTLGEIFDLEALAEDCERDGVWEFFFSAPPLKVVGGVGSPITPLAVK
nr:cyclase family protein [Sphingomonas sp. Y57]